jgi:hypothetical protein
MLELKDFITSFDNSTTDAEIRQMMEEAGKNKLLQVDF